MRAGVAGAGARLAEAQKLAVGSADELRASLWSASLARVKAMLAESDGVVGDWAGARKPPANGVVEVEATAQFHRLWSALAFLFNTEPIPYQGPPAPGSDAPTMCEVDDLEQFGHGFYIAGATIVSLLGQRARFELLDFTAHVVEVARHDALEERVKREREENVAKSSASIFGGGSKRGSTPPPPQAHADIKRSAEDFVRAKQPDHAQLHGMVFAMVERALPSAPARKLAFAPPASFE